MRHVTIFWTCTRQARRRIQERFGMPDHTGVNGESEADISDEDFPLFTETMQRGFFKVRHKQSQESHF